MKKEFFFWLTGLLAVEACSGQLRDADTAGLKEHLVFNREMRVDSGTVHLDERAGVGIAWIDGQSVTEGIIEFDVRGNDRLQQSFVGIAFHGLNDSTYEAVYFRPFNFKSNDSVRRNHAIQYIAPPGFDWEILRATHANVYEQAIRPSPDPNDWFHVRLQIEKERVSVWVNNQSAPCLVVKPLVALRGRRLGYWVGYGSSGGWRNLRVRHVG